MYSPYFQPILTVAQFVVPAIMIVAMIVGYQRRHQLGKASTLLMTGAGLVLFREVFNQVNYRVYPYGMVTMGTLGELLALLTLIGWFAGLIMIVMAVFAPRPGRLPAEGTGGPTDGVGGPVELDDARPSAITPMMLIVAAAILIAAIVIVLSLNQSAVQ